MTLGTGATLTGTGTAGAITMTGGTVTQSGGGLTLSSISGRGTVNGAPTVTTITASGGTLDLTGPISGAALVIAASTASNLTIDGTATAGAIAIANNTQTLEIGTAGSLTITAAESITNGKIQLDGGTLIDAAGVTIGTGATLTGKGTVTANLSGTGTVTASGGPLDLTGNVSGPTLAIATASGSNLKIDGTATAGAIAIANNTQTLEIGTAGSLTITAAESITNGTIQLDGGTLIDAAGVTLGTGATLTGTGTAGAITMTGGTVTQSGGGLTLSSITGRGTVNGAPTVTTITASGGPLDLTGPISGAALVIATASGSDLKIDGTMTTGAIAISNVNQTLEIGTAGSLTITAAESITSGTIKLDGGTLIDAAGVTIGTGATLTGTGTVTANLSGAGTVTASGGPLDLTGNVSGPTLAIATASGSNLKIDGTATAGAIAIANNTQTLEIGTAGKLTLTTAESITSGTIQLDGGTLIDAAGVTLGTGATLTGTGTAGAITMTGGTVTQSGGGLTLSSITGRGTVNGAPTVTTITASGGPLDLTGPISGAALVIATASGSDLKIDGTMTTGAIAISNVNQTLEIGTAGSLTITAAESITSGKIQLDGGTLIDAAGVTIGTGATLTGSGTVTANLSGPGTVTASGGPLDLTGNVSGLTLAIATASGSNLTIDGTATAGAIAIANNTQTLEIGTAGKLTLTTAESITSGTIKLDGGTLIDAAGVTIGTGATLTGSGTVTANLSGTGTVTASGGPLDLTGNVNGPTLAIATASGSDLKIDGTATAGTISISNANQTLEIGTAGKLTLTAAESITSGTIQLDGGTLIDAAGVTLGTGATLTGTGTAGAITMTGGTVTQSGGGLTLSSISGRGTVNGAPTVTTITASGGPLDLTGPISGAALVIAASTASDLKIDGTMTTGAIAISNVNQTLEIGTAGSLTITAAESITNGKIQLDGGTLIDAAGVTIGSGATLTGKGTVTANLSGAGTVTASGGPLDLVGSVSGPTLVIATASGSDLKIDGTATAGAIAINNSNQTLEVGFSTHLTISAAESITNGTIKLDGGNLTDTFGLTIGSGATLTGQGIIGAGTAVNGTGSIIANGGTIEFQGPVDISSLSTFEINNLAWSSFKFDGLVGTAAVPVTIKFDGQFGILDLSAEGDLSNFHGQVANFGAGNIASDWILVSGAAGDSVQLQGDGHTLWIYDTTSAHVKTISLVGDYTGAHFQLSNSGGVDTITTDAACFMAGTMIRTPAGDVAIEHIKRGDMVLTNDGQTKAVSWLGRQTISTVFSDPLRVWPIRIKAGALGENVPARDLRLSPDHAVLVDGALIQAGALVNGTSIVRETAVPKVFVYYHVELDDHSLILAENAPAETFIDNVDRLAFDNWTEHEALYPDGKPIEELPYPRAKAHRQVPVEMRIRLAERAQAIGAAADVVAA